MYQVIEIRLNDESGIETDKFLTMLAPELQRPSHNLIVKHRVLHLLASLSDYDALKSNQSLQEDLVRGVMSIFANTS